MTQDFCTDLGNSELMKTYNFSPLIHKTLKVIPGIVKMKTGLKLYHKSFIIEIVFFFPV